MGIALKLSVAMCTYNGAQYVQEQLASIAAQTRTPDELVICDDRSTDNTVQIIEAFAATAPFPVRLSINEQNLGSTVNFGRAIGLCTGDAIALSDQDDVWLPEKLERLEACFASAPGAGLVFSDGEVVDECLRSLERSVWEFVGFGEKERKLFEEGEAFGVLLNHNVVTGAAMAFRSVLKDLVLPIPPDLFHDGWKMIHDGWIALVISAVAELATVPEPLFKYRRHERQQIGFPSAPDNLTRSRGAAPSRDFASETHYLRTITARLSKRPDLRDRKALGRLTEKLLHLEGRAALPGSKLARVPFVARELLTFRYSMYSNGARSAARDLLF
jgi:glycosyltransferase involved in cell wall biosynthesis